MSIDLLYSDVEESLRASTTGLLAARQTTSALSDCYDGDDSVRTIWAPLAQQIGIAGLLVPEELGGAGATAREAGVVAEALGHGVAAVPFLTSAVIATRILVGVGASEQLDAMMDGSATAVLAAPFSSPPGTVPATVNRTDTGLTGAITSVADANRARWLLVPARSPQDGLELHLVEAKLATVRPVVSFDMTRPLADVSLNGVASTLLAVNEQAEHLIGDALLYGAAILSCEQLGVSRWCLDTTLEYVKTRYQFGRAIGSYQAVKHRLADLWVNVIHATAAARYAVDCLARQDDDSEVAGSLAQASCSEVAVHAAEETIQLHGGLGMTWEHPAHLYLKRAKADQIALGTSGWHRAHLAALVDLTP